MTPREYVAELERLEPGLRDEYLAEIARIVDAATLAEIERLLDEGNVNGIVLALGIAAAFTGFIERTRAVYVQAGSFELPSEPFNPRSPGAENWMRTNAEQFIQRTEAATAEAIRQVVQAGRMDGRSTRKIALDIAGRVDKQTGNRTGGVIGSSDAEAIAVTNARRQLESGDPEQLRAYLTRTRRDRRFDAMVKRAIEAQKPVAAADVERIVGRYAARLLKSRADSIARTAVLGAINGARQEKYEQQIQRGKLTRGQITKEWQTTGDINVRDTHQSMNHQRQPVESPFQSPSGAILMFPGDQSFGAPLAEVANCRCGAFYRVRKT